MRGKETEAPRHRSGGRTSGWPALITLCLLITIAFGLRVIELDRLPLSLSLDESVNGLDALQLWRTRWLMPFLQNNFGRDTLFFYIQGVVLWLSGISIFSLRWASAVIGVLTIPLLHRVGQRMGLGRLVSSTPLWPGMVGLLAATGLAVSYWHLYFSRVALRAILLLPLLLAQVWCFWNGWYPRQTGPTVGRWQRWRWLAAAGLLLGISFYTYLAARLLPVVFAVFVIVELTRNRSNRKVRLGGLLVFGTVAGTVSIPLILYFIRNPQAMASRAQAISILNDGAFLPALAGNARQVLFLHFGGGWWLGHWPTLNVLSGVGFLVGLLVCLSRIRRPASLFLLLWWGVGWAPTLLSQQHWDRVTTILRGVVAWPATFLISAVGLTTLAWLAFMWLRRLMGWPPPAGLANSRKWLAVPVGFLLFAGLATVHNYYFVFANTQDQSSSQSLSIAGYLNGQSNQLTLTPNKFYANPAVNFLLQGHYPTLASIDFDELRSLLNSSEKQMQPVYLLPHRSTSQSAFTLLVPAADGKGTGYLLPQLSPAQEDALSQHTRAILPLSSVPGSEQDPMAQVYPLGADVPFWLQTPLPMESAYANFDHNVLLTGYHVEPDVVQPGQPVTLVLRWQALDRIDGDHDLFIHLFDLTTGQRYGQMNASLGSTVLLPAHRWPAGLTVRDRHQFKLPPTAPQGVYRFELGLYHRSSQQRLPVITGEEGQATGDSIILGKFRLQSESPSPPQQALRYEFDGGIALIGIDVASVPGDEGEARFTLHWQATGPISQDYTVFTHLVDSQGNLIAQQDNVPQKGRYPTSLWSPGEIVLDPYVLHLPPDLLPGRYALRVGLYHPQTGQRLPVQNGAMDYVELPIAE